MPVLDHEVHPCTKIGKEWRYGCWNLQRPRVGDAIYGRESRETWIYNFSTECRNDVSLSDPACEGCEWAGTGEKYDEMVRREGK